MREGRGVAVQRIIQRLLTGWGVTEWTKVIGRSRITSVSCRGIYSPFATRFFLGTLFNMKDDCGTSVDGLYRKTEGNRFRCSGHTWVTAFFDVST